MVDERVQSRSILENDRIAVAMLLLSLQRSSSGEADDS